MNNTRISLCKAVCILLTLEMMLAGCAIAPEDLETPESMSCVYLAEPVSRFWRNPILDVMTEIRLERGPYISEKRDEEGTYYRAPTGGLYIGAAPYKDHTPDKPKGNIFNGGIYFPNDKTKEPRLYTYKSLEYVYPEPPNESINCQNITYYKEPNSQKLNVVSYVGSGAVGGFVAGVVVKGVNQNSNYSYGQSATAGVIGGAIAGGIVAMMINMDVGKIFKYPEIDDMKFTSKLRDLEESTVNVEEMKK